MSHSGWSCPGLAAGELPTKDVDSTSLTLAEQYDAKIDALYAEIRNLCASRNEQCSATRKLPAEVLSMVFQELPDRDASLRRVPPCIYASHVCRSWRSAALTDPMLWNNIAGLSKRWLKLSLRRAADVPLKLVYPREHPPLYYDYNSDSSLESLSSTSSSPKLSVDATLEGILDVPERLGELKLVDGTPGIINRLFRPTPFLSALMLHGKFSVPLNFVGNDAPRLQSFTSYGSSFPSQVTWLRNLQTLILSERWGIKDTAGNDMPINTASFLGLLSALDKLENLTVGFDSSRETVHQDYTGKLICLPSLRYARFAFRPRSIHLANLFSHIQLPSIHTLDIEWPVHNYDDKTAHRPFMSFVATCRLPFRRMVWDFAMLPSMNLSCFPGGPTCSVKGGQIMILSDELPFQGLETIEELHIFGFRSLSNLLISSTSPMIYPSLKKLSFQSTQLRHKPSSGNLEERTPKCMIQMLRRWLKRRTAPHNLESLIITGDQYVTAQDIKSLEKIVPVTWIRDPNETLDLEW